MNIPRIILTELLEHDVRHTFADGTVTHVPYDADGGTSIDPNGELFEAEREDHVLKRAEIYRADE